jgi:hypothetical protein
MRSLTRSIAIFHKVASSASLEATTAIIAITARSTAVMFSKTFLTFFTCLLVGWPMRNLTRSITIFYKIARCASPEATAAIIAITARSALMFTIVCIFRGDAGAHDLLL